MMELFYEIVNDFYRLTSSLIHMGHGPKYVSTFLHYSLEVLRKFFGILFCFCFEEDGGESLMNIAEGLSIPRSKRNSQPAFICSK